MNEKTNLWPTKEKKQHTLRKLGIKPRKKNLLSMTVLVGDEIQRRVIKSRRG
jgi:hypothetical protein